MLPKLLRAGFLPFAAGPASKTRFWPPWPASGGGFSRRTGRKRGPRRAGPLGKCSWPCLEARRGGRGRVGPLSRPGAFDLCWTVPEEMKAGTTVEGPYYDSEPWPGRRERTGLGIFISFFALRWQLTFAKDCGPRIPAEPKFWQSSGARIL